MIASYLKRRRATETLAEAMRARDGALMRQAIQSGADLERVRIEQEESAQIYRMTYEVRGALPIAVELEMTADEFSLLMECGARLPLDDDGKPCPEKLFPSSSRESPWAQSIITILKACQSKQALDSETPHCQAGTSSHKPRL